MAAFVAKQMVGNKLSAVKGRSYTSAIEITTKVTTSETYEPTTHRAATVPYLYLRLSIVMLSQTYIIVT